MKSNRRKPHRHSRPSSRLRLERLEQRVPFAADIGVQLSGSALGIKDVWLDDGGFSSSSATYSQSPASVNFAESIEVQRPAEWDALVFVNGSFTDGRFPEVGYLDSNFGADVYHDDSLLAFAISTNVGFVGSGMEIVNVRQVNGALQSTPINLSSNIEAEARSHVLFVDDALFADPPIVQAGQNIRVSTSFSERIAEVDSVEIASTGRSFIGPVVSSIVSTDASSALPQTAAAQAILAPPMRASDVAFSEPARLQPQFEKLRTAEPKSIDGRTALRGAIAMSNGMRTLGLDVVHERLEAGQQRFALEQLPHSPHTLESDLQQGAEPIGDWESISQRARLEHSFMDIAIAGSHIEPTQLFIGGPIERMHGFEAFDIFRDLVAEAPVIQEPTELAAHQVSELPLGRAIWLAGLTIGFGTFGASLYVLNHHEFTRRVRSEKSRAHTILVPMWGHATFWAIDELLDETKPMIVQIRM